MERKIKEKNMNAGHGPTPYETREILLYKTDNGDVRVEILLYQENLWLTQVKMAELFEVQKAAISKHLKNIFESGELLEEAVVSKMETTATDGKRYKTNYYNLDAIIAVGYRVNSRKATMFRIWANRSVLLLILGIRDGALDLIFYFIERAGGFFHAEGFRTLNTGKCFRLHI
jgi:virulence protein